MSEWSEQLKSLLSSPLGKYMLESLDKLHDSVIDSAERETSMEISYGLTKEARGIITAKGHLVSLARPLPKDDGSKSK